MTARTILQATGIVCGLLSLMTPAPLWAADGGVVLTFGLGQLLESNTDSAGNQTLSAATQLSLGLSSQTRLSTLAFDVSGGLSAVNGPGTDPTQFDISDPDLMLSYQRVDANASFGLTASAQEQSLQFLDLLQNPDDITDLTDLIGTGLLRASSLQTTLSWGDASPFGIGLSAGFSRNDYVGVTDPDLVDNRQQTLGVETQFRLNAAASASLGLNFRHFVEDGVSGTDRRTKGLQAGLMLDRPTGSWDTNLQISETPEGRRSSLDFGRSVTLPNGKISANLGATLAENGKTYLTGVLSLQAEGPRSQIATTLSRDVGAGNDDTATLLSTLAVSYSQVLDPRTSLDLGLTYQDSQDIATGLVIQTGSLGASVNYALTRDWGLNAGVRHDLRAEDGLDQTATNTVFLQLSRSFTFRP